MSFFNKNNKQERSNVDGWDIINDVISEKKERTFQQVKAGKAPIVVSQTRRITNMNINRVPTTNSSMSIPFVSERLIGVATTIGRRSSQQDAVAVTPSEMSGSFSGNLFAVLCDGMGGMNGGEKASSISVNTAVSEYKKNTEPIPNFYRELIDKVDYYVSSLEDEDGRCLGAGSTFVSVCIDNGDIYWASVGDSHLYIIRSGNMSMVVNEHNYLQDLLELVNAKELTIDEALNDKSKDALTSYIGMGGVAKIDLLETPLSLKNDDVILLCSDGLYRTLSNEEIQNIIENNFDDMNAAASNLIECCMNKGNPYQDNTSVILIKYKK